MADPAMPDLAMIAVRWALYALTGLLFGLPLFALSALRDGERVGGSALRYRSTLAASAIAALLLSGLWLALLGAAMGGTPLTEVTGETLGMIVRGTAIGVAWTVRVAALAMIVPLALAGGRMPRIALAGITAAGAVALASLAWTGHGAVTEGAPGWLHLIADIVHLLAAGAWIGALAAFLGLAFRRGTDPALAHRVLHGFATTGTAIVLLLLATGLVNGWMLVGPARLGALLTTDYGRLLSLKLALFAAMLGFAALNRYRLTPALAGGSAAFGALRRSLMLESAAALAILLIVAWLGMLSPPASA